MTASEVATSATTETAKMTAPANTTYVFPEPTPGTVTYAVQVHEPSKRD
jgi:hypothetical protein